jgi:peptidoglycan hydrolase-like protein with peptidoglycan-binding domain
MSSAADQNKNLSPEYIKKVQTHLKQAGFYSGRVDGMADAGTHTAVRHFQTSCTGLKDLMTTSALANSQSPGAKATVVKIKRGGVDATRVVQLRLKDAGFDPGPIDGIHGAKTQAALVSLRSGCALLKNFSLASEATAAGISEHSAAISADNFESPSGANNRGTVKSLQARLRNAGFDPGPIDGVLGPRTRSALQQYQASVAKVSALR